MNVLGEVGTIYNKMKPQKLKAIKQYLHETKESVFNMDKRILVNGAVAVVLVAGTVALVNPIVKAHLLSNDVGEIEMVTIQEETADFLKINAMAVNYANTTLTDIYTYVQSGFSVGQENILLSKKIELEKYKEQLTPSNPLFLELSQNSTQKITLLLSAIDGFVDRSTSHEEDLVKLNVYTSEFKKTTENEKSLLIGILEYAGMNYELLEDGQIRYSYLKMNEAN